MSQTIPRQLAFIVLYLAGLVAAPSHGVLLGAALSPASAGFHAVRCGSRQAARSNLQRAICIAAKTTGHRRSKSARTRQSVAILV